MTTQRRRPARPLRILFAIHAPWDMRYGLPQGLMEPMRQLQTRGYHCEKFSEEDAFRHPRAFMWLRFPFTVALFQRKLLRHIRRLGDSVDVVVVDQMACPYPRSRYRFSGRIVARSQGLVHFYHSYMSRRADGGRAGWMQRLGWWASGGVEAVERTFRTVDQIYLLNSDELAFVRDELGHGDRCVLVPSAITEERRETLAASCRIERRLASVTIASVGVWSARKGQQNVPGIVRAVRSRKPEVRFKLLGTQFPAEQVLDHIAPQDRHAVEVVPSFPREDLPALLAEARVGMFLSYMEGFGIGLLEMLAAGIPVVAWDTSGPRDILASMGRLSLIPAGDETRTAVELTRLLECDRDEYVSLSEACRKQSERFTWERVADTIEEATLEPLMARLE